MSQSPASPPPFLARMARRGLLASALLAGALLLAAASAAAAATITVSTTTDEVNADGDCSLREAVRAANTNAAVDACPAGSSAAQDTIVLADGALYELTITGIEDAALQGDLDILDNAAAQDLLLTVADDGTATVSQRAKPDDTVLFVGAGANVAISGVVVADGTSPSGQGGGGLKAGAGATVALADCAFTDNVASEGGGAIDFGTGTLTVVRCVFARNVSIASAGAAIRSGKSAIVTVADSVFEDNDAGDHVGGAMLVGAALTVTGSSFVDNRALSGGAIAVATGAGVATTVTTSCFVGNSDAALEPVNDAPITANGNWWGSSDGPSGLGSGSGDAIDDDVDAATFATAPLAGCRPVELLANGGFEDREIGGGPARWRLRRLGQPNDGVQCSSSGCELQMNGDGELNQALQTVLIAGDAGDTVTFRATGSGKNVPATAGKFQVELSLVHADGSKQRKTLKCGSGSFGDDVREKQIVATEPFVRVKVRAMYDRASGLARSDDLSVVLE